MNALFLPLLSQLHGRTKSLFSAMRKILRLGDMAAGGRRLEQLHDLLGLRAIVQPRTDLPEDQARLAAVEVTRAVLLPALADEIGLTSCPVTCSRLSCRSRLVQQLSVHSG